MSQGTKRILIIAILLTLLSGTVFSIMAFRVVAQGERLTEQIAAIEAQQAQRSSYDRLFGVAKETESERAQLNGYFLEKEGEMIDLLKYVESVASAAAVTLETNELEVITIGTKEDPEQWIKVSFSFSGTKENVQNFLQVLETLPYVQRVTGLQMEALSSSLWQAEVTMQVRILTYDE